jgi:hypothetical protein
MEVREGWAGRKKFSVLVGFDVLELRVKTGPCGCSDGSKIEDKWDKGDVEGEESVRFCYTLSTGRTRHDCNAKVISRQCLILMSCSFVQRAQIK